MTRLSAPSTTLAVALLMVLAGCLGGGESLAPEDDDVAPPRFKEDSGAIEGFVTDEEGLPVENAMVGLIRTEPLVTITNTQGRFVFEDIQPGRQTINVQKLGYNSAAVNVEVRVGETARVDIPLKAIRIAEPYHETHGPFSGFFECRASFVIPSVASWTAGCGTVCAAGGCYGGVSWPNDRTSMRFEMSSDDYRTVLGEMRWTQGSTATSQELRMSFSHVGRTSTHWFCSGEGPSLLSWKFERATADEEAECYGASRGGNRNPAEPSTETELLAYTNVPFARFGTSNPTGEPFFLALQQHYEFIVGIYYGEPAPPETVVFGDV